MNAKLGIPKEGLTLPGLPAGVGKYMGAMGARDTFTCMVSEINMSKSINASLFYLFISIDFDSPESLSRKKNIFRNYTVFHNFNYFFLNYFQSSKL